MVDSGNHQQLEPVCNFFRKSSKNKNIRKRTFDDDEDEDSKTESSVIHKQKSPKPDKKLHFSTGPSKCLMSTESNIESDSLIFQFESSKEIQVQHDSQVTTTLEIETEFSKDARAIRERVLKQAEEALKGKIKSSGDESCVEVFMAMLITRLGSEESTQFLVRKLVGHMGLLGLLLTLGRQRGSIISQTFVRITKRLVTVGMEIHVSLCMTEGIISLDGYFGNSDPIIDNVSLVNLRFCTH